MDFLSKCYKGRIRLFVDGVPREVSIRWFWADPDAGYFPFSHCWGSQVYKAYLHWDEGGAIELDGFRWERHPELNPGYLHKCVVGDREWWQTGNIPASALVNPPALPVCCYVFRRGLVDGQARLRLTPRATLTGPPAILGRASLALTCAGLVERAQDLAGRAPLLYTAAGRLAVPMFLAGRASLALTDAGHVVPPHTIAGVAPLLYTAAGRLAVPMFLTGQASLALTDAGQVVPPHTIAGVAPLLYTPRADLELPYFYSGDAGMDLSPRAGFLQAYGGCSDYPGGTAMNYQVVMSGCTFPFDDLNGTWVFPMGPGCGFSATLNSSNASGLLSSSSPNVFVQFNALGTSPTSYELAGGFNPFGSNLLTATVWPGNYPQFIDFSAL